MIAWTFEMGVEPCAGAAVHPEDRGQKTEFKLRG